MEIGRANKLARERNLDRMANLGRRPTAGQQFEAGQAGVTQYLRDKARTPAPASPPPSTGPGKATKGS